MDPSRLGIGEKIAAGSALVLLISLFLPWYGVKFRSLDVGGDATAWEAFSFIDIVLFLAAIVVLGLVAAKAAGALPALPTPAGTIIAAAGALALALIVYRLIDSPAPNDLPDSIDITRKLGIFIALISAGALTFGGYRAMHEA